MLQGTDRPKVFSAKLFLTPINPGQGVRASIRRPRALNFSPWGRSGELARGGQRNADQNADDRRNELGRRRLRDRAPRRGRRRVDYQRQGQSSAI
jgi:hypothetical protein